MMFQRWMKTLAAFSICAVMFSACKKNTYSTDDPLVNANTPSVFVGSQNQILYALDPATGKYKWERNLKANIVAVPVVVGKYLYVPAADTLYKLDVNTGEKLKALTLGNDPLPGWESSPVTDGKALFIASKTGVVYSIDPNTDNINWSVNVNDPIHASLCIYELYGAVLVVASENNIFTYNLNGTPRWTVPMSVLGGAKVISSPVVSMPYIYFGTSDFKLQALTADLGVPAWSYTTAGIVNSSPIVYGGNVIFGSADNYVYCIDSITKQPRWKFKTQDRVHSSPAASGQVVYIGGYDSYLYAINILDGELKWRYKTTALIQSSPVVYNGKVYVSGFDKYLYAIDTSGSFKWSYNVGGPVETSPIIYDLTKTYYPSITGFGQY